MGVASVPWMCSICVWVCVCVYMCLACALLQTPNIYRARVQTHGNGSQAELTRPQRQQVQQWEQVQRQRQRQRETTTRNDDNLQPTNDNIADTSFKNCQPCKCCMRKHLTPFSLKQCKQTGNSTKQKDTSGEALSRERQQQELPGVDRKSARSVVLGMGGNLVS